MYISVLSCVLSGVVLILSSLNVHGKEVPPGVYTYRETAGKIITPFYWKVEEKEQQRLVSVYEKGKSFINLCSTDGATWQWQLKDSAKKNDINAKRQGNELKISGIRNGETYQETVELDERPWFQPLSYSLRAFLDSEQESITFWTIRADTIEVTSLQAEKQGEEEILINGKKTPAQIIEVHAEGFYAHFWHGTYWYRKSDNLFLMYRSVHGLPGTAETVVELTAEPDV